MWFVECGMVFFEVVEFELGQRGTIWEAESGFSVEYVVV